jgi:hypothetical protein
MRRLSVITAALAAAFAVGNANALVILIDDFNSPDLTVIDQAGGGATVVGPTLPNGRTVSHELLAGTNDLGGSGSIVKIGTVAFPAGSLEMANANLRDSEVKVTWTLAAGLVLDSSNGPASFLFDVLASDGNPTTAELFFNNVSIGLFVIPGNTFNLPLAYGVSAATQNLMNAGGTMTLAINGATGWDMSLDSFGVTIPEPTSLALVGLALLGAGVASRRRKA